jgi:lysophospholipase L1-like esterase
LAVVWRSSLVTAACVAVVGVLALMPVSPVRAATRPPWQAPGAAARDALFFYPQARVQRLRAPGGSLAGCERELIRTRSAPGPRPPVLAIVGASFTAGVGPGRPDQAWAVQLARNLRWDAVIDGVPGAGYVRAGVGRNGPVATEIARVDLRALDPALVIVQAGHDDIGVPASLERRRVAQAVALIRAQAPQARIALLTVFPGRTHLAAARRTDQAIVTAGTAADRQAIIMDPLTGDWKFVRVRAGLHPTAAGDAWIAAAVATILREHGVSAQPARDASGTICDSGIPGPASPR